MATNFRLTTLQLVKQKAPLLIHKGDKSDCIGPGNYDPSIAPTKPNARGSDFSRSKSARTSITRAVPEGAMLELNPGPGTYQVARARAHTHTHTDQVADRATETETEKGRDRDRDSEV